MTQRKWDIMDFFGWFATKIWWSLLWILCQHDGVVSWSDIRDQYDGSLFERIERERMGFDKNSNGSGAYKEREFKERNM